MNPFHNIYAVIVVTVVALVDNGGTINCWSCSSEASGPCGVAFNATQADAPLTTKANFKANPRLVKCSARPSPHEQLVCLKCIYTDSSIKATMYLRKCYTLIGGFEVGPCPPQLTSEEITIDFCETCDKNGCNGPERIPLASSQATTAALTSKQPCLSTFGKLSLSVLLTVLVGKSIYRL